MLRVPQWRAALIGLAATLACGGRANSAGENGDDETGDSDPTDTGDPSDTGDDTESTDTDDTGTEDPDMGYPGEVCESDDVFVWLFLANIADAATAELDQACVVVYSKLGDEGYEIMLDCEGEEIDNPVIVGTLYPDPLLPLEKGDPVRFRWRQGGPAWVNRAIRIDRLGGAFDGQPVLAGVFGEDLGAELPGDEPALFVPFDPVDGLCKLEEGDCGLEESLAIDFEIEGDSHRFFRWEQGVVGESPGVGVWVGDAHHNVDPCLDVPVDWFSVLLVDYGEG